MNFTGTLHGSQVEIRPLDKTLMAAVQASVLGVADQPQDVVDLITRAAACHLAIVSAINVPMSDGTTTTEWDQAAPAFADPDFMTDVVQVGLLLGMGYEPTQEK